MQKKYRFIDILFGVISIFAVMMFAISFSAFIPCFFKGFYTPWINWLNIPESSHFTYERIVNGYSNIIDFLWKRSDFNPGIPMSESGIDHFRDCIPLFWMQLWFMFSSTLYLLIYHILIKVNKVKRVYFLRLPLYSFGGILTIISLAAIGIFAAIDFDTLFVLFHKVFFPGKSNWVFDPNVDQVIRILPETYFLVCAVFIIGLSILISVLSIVIGIIDYKNKKEREFVSSFYSTVLVVDSIDRLTPKSINKIKRKDREKVLSYKNENDQKLSLLARLLEKEYLGNHKIGYNEQNKPILKGPIQYNLSHKERYVVIGLSSSIIGVDIEKNKELDGSFIEFSFSKDEIKNMEVMGYSPVKMWTIKEALLKCVGTGIIKKPNQEVVIIKSENSLLYQNETYFFASFNYGDYIISVVSKDNNLPSEVKHA